LLSLATDPIPWPLHPALAALLPRLQLVADCWHLLADPNGSDRREHYLPRGEREPESAYRRRVEAALPSGFFRDALRTFAGMLASSHWRELPATLQAVISDVDGCGTDLGVFLEAADLLVLRDGAALVGVIPPVHLWPSEGDRQQALRNGDRLSLPRLLLIERGDVLHWQLPGNHALPDAITWRERRPNAFTPANQAAPPPEPPPHPVQYLTASLVGDGSPPLRKAESGDVTGARANVLAGIAGACDDGDSLTHVTGALSQPNNGAGSGAPALAHRRSGSTSLNEAPPPIDGLLYGRTAMRCTKCGA